MAQGAEEALRRELAEAQDQLRRESRLRARLAAELAREQQARWKSEEELAGLRLAQAPLREAERELSRFKGTVLYRPFREVIRIERQIRRLLRGAGTTLSPTPVLLPERHIPAPESIILPAPDPKPEVSVLILSYGQVDYTLCCLKSIADNPPACSLEIIVSDDFSGDADLHKLARVQNLKFIRPARNLKIMAHANWAVGHTKGDYILLLNNDTELGPGAIDALIDTARDAPDIGLVGSKLVYPDGRLQEAGAIVWRDATGWNYGRFQDPGRPEYNYLRDVDYVSGASILLPRALWDELGGLDESFTPAYCEDVDLAFRIRQRGLRVVYQPTSVVTHFEGVTMGTDVTKGLKAHQPINQAKLRERWSRELAAEHFDSGKHVLRARDRALGKRVILVVDHFVPQPDRDAGSRSMMSIIRALQSQGYIVKFWPENLRYDETYTPLLQQMGIETTYAPWVRSLEEWLRENRGEIDLFLLSRPTVARKCIEVIRRNSPKSPILYYGHDLHFERMKLQAELAGDDELMAESGRMEALERSVWRDVDVVLYPSEEEARRVNELESLVLARPIVPYAFDTFRTRTAPPPDLSLIFVAGFAHPPNVDAAVWLVEEVLPLVRRQLPQVRLSLVGSNPTDQVRALAGPNVDVTGYVTDAELAELYDTARVAIVPLRFGAGVKLKVVEAMQMGVPLVTTWVGGQGLPGLGSVASVQDQPEALARECVNLLQDDARWRRQSASQSEYARSVFSLEAMRASLSDAIDACPRAERDRKLSERRPR